MTIPEPYKSAHKKASHNKEALLASPLAGCFYCLCIYPSTQIVEFCDKGATAICPECDVDSVVPVASTDLHRLEEADVTFLEEMNKHWFALVPKGK